MNKIHSILNCYYKHGLIQNKPEILTRRIQSVNPSQLQIQQLSQSIKYPYRNGIFVIYLDNSSKKEFLNFIFLNKKIKHIENKLLLFYKKLKNLTSHKTIININTFKFKSFNKPLNKSIIRPRLTRKIYQ